jgi:very-short-patch-repair endonuclease
MSDTYIFEIIQNAYSIHDVCIKLYGYSGGSGDKKVKSFIKDNNVDITHFEKKNKRRKYEIIEKKCVACESTFSVSEKFNQVTCSVSCSNTYFRSNKSNETKTKISSSLKSYYENQCDDQKTKTKTKISNSLKLYHGNQCIEQKTRTCKHCEKSFTPWLTKSGKISRSTTCSEKCSDESRSINLKKSASKRVEEGTHQGWFSRNIESFPESFFKRVLSNNNIPFEFNKPLKKRDLGIDCNSNYFLDFYLPEANIDLEIDGSQHKYRKEHDLYRDQHISKFFDVYRIEWKDLKNEKGKKYIYEEIQKFLEYYNTKCLK